MLPQSWTAGTVALPSPLVSAPGAQGGEAPGTRMSNARRTARMAGTSWQLEMWGGGSRRGIAAQVARRAHLGRIFAIHLGTRRRAREDNLGIPEPTGVGVSVV